MKKSTIWLLTVVMAFAFLGFIYVQITYMENMIDMRNEQFSESVMRSLNSVSSQLEQDETKYFLEEDIADLGVLYPNLTKSEFQFDIKPGKHPFMTNNDLNKLPSQKNNDDNEQSSKSSYDTSRRKLRCI